MRVRSTLFLSVAVLAAVPALAQQNAGEGQTDAAAQTSPRAQADATGTPAVQTQAPQDQALDDIVVTARKREETLLDVPIAVTAVSGDLIVEQNGMAYYLARISITEAGFKELGDRQLQSGMPVEVIFITGKRSMLTYLLHPLVKRLAASMKEE